MEIEILNEDRLRYWCGRIEIPEEATTELAEIARQVREDEGLRSNFTEFHQKTAIRGDWYRDWEPLPFDPVIQAAFGQRTSLFYVLAYLAALPYTEQDYLRRGIGLDVFHDTLLDFRIWMVRFHELEGYWGYGSFMWIWRHLTGELFRLGRLQFALADFEWQVVALRKKTTGQIVLLADPALPLREDGYAAGAGRMPEDSLAQPTGESSTGRRSDEGGGSEWLPAFEARDDGWLGNPVSPYGFAARETVFLPRAEWEVVLQRGNTILDLHIPRGSALTPDACRDSLRQAFAFFPRYYPARPFKASFCHTWFFTAQLQQILPRESNLVRFQREFYLFPHPGGPGFLWSYVFNEKCRDPRTAPRDTSLRRAVLDWLAGGGELFDLPGLMFHGPEEWGSQPYMGAWDRKS